ncbi:glycosyltransferase family 9 protein [Chitinophaga sp. OAE865]|uniref:glycosyltransferase family 9 protein n=1 Tax=Chitinophaga sp. OAE865 TaxID=2817898 RepID=UPI001D5F9508
MMFSHIQRIAILRALQLGDLLCAVPAFRALRAAFPQAHITLIGLPWANTFQQRFSHYIDEVMVFPGYPGLPEQPPDPAAFNTFMSSVKSKHYDLILQMQGNGTLVNPLVQSMGARYTAGFTPKGSVPESELFVLYPEDLHEIERHLYLLEQLGIPPAGKHLEFPLTSADRDSLRNLQLPCDDYTYICVHPGSRAAWRQWPPPYFAAMADHLADQGWKIVLTGSIEEKELTLAVKSYMRFPALDVAGELSLGGMAMLIKKSRALVSNCTGVSHIAAATATPSVIISMDGEPHRWAPLNTHLHCTTDWTRHNDFDRMLIKADELLARTESRCYHRA